MRFFAILLFAACAHAAIVEGVVLDEETGNPLARAQVTLTPLPGTKAGATSVRTGARGSFVVLSVVPGWYVLRATRRGYVPAESGQSKPGRPGHAFEVADNRATGFVELHMSHLAAISGTVLDENGIGIPRWPVHIYSARKPMRHIGQTITDDRGDYRIGELDAGTYYLRSGPGHFEDQAPVLATYSKAAVELKDAWPTGISIGQTQPNITIRPVKGPLLTLSGLFLPPPEPGGASLTLITDTGRREIASGNKPQSISIPDVQPGPIELVVTGNDGFGRDCGSYSALTVDKDIISTLRLACNPINPGSVQITGATPQSRLIVRRVDLDGVSETHALGRNELFRPGHWELSVPRGDYFVQSVTNFRQPAPQSGSWYNFLAGSSTSVQVSLSTRVATVSGVVSAQGNPVSGAPVFLVETTTGESWAVRADPVGHYVIGGLGPGTYAIRSSFDIDGIEGFSSKGGTFDVSLGSSTVRQLELYRQ